MDDVRYKRVPLSMLREGEEGVITDIYGGRGLKLRLITLGFLEGKRVKVIENRRGPLIVEILPYYNLGRGTESLIRRRGYRVILGKGAADKIYVRRGY